MSGQELYEAYREARLRKAGQMFMPAWDGLPGEERDAWLGLEAVVAARVSPQRAQRATEDVAEAVTLLLALQVRAQDEALSAADLEPVIELLEPTG